MAKLSQAKLIMKKIKIKILFMAKLNKTILIMVLKITLN